MREPARSIPRGIVPCRQVKVVKNHNTRGEVAVRAESVGKRVALMENTKVVRDMQIAAREDIRVEDPVITMVSWGRYMRYADDDREVL